MKYLATHWESNIAIILAQNVKYTLQIDKIYETKKILKHIFIILYVEKILLPRAEISKVTDVTL